MNSYALVTLVLLFSASPDICAMEKAAPAQAVAAQDCEKICFHCEEDQQKIVDTLADFFRSKGYEARVVVGDKEMPRPASGELLMPVIQPGHRFDEIVSIGSLTIKRNALLLYVLPSSYWSKERAAAIFASGFLSGFTVDSLNGRPAIPWWFKATGTYENPRFELEEREIRLAEFLARIKSYYGVSLLSKEEIEERKKKSIPVAGSAEQTDDNGCIIL